MKTNYLEIKRLQCTYIYARMYRVMRPDGILVVDGTSKRQEFFQGLKETGFMINQLDVAYFGEEFYAVHGFNEDAVLWVAAKQDIFRISQD